MRPVLCGLILAIFVLPAAAADPPADGEQVTIKISPPLVITEAAIHDSLNALEEAFAEALVAHSAVA